MCIIFRKRYRRRKERYRKTHSRLWHKFSNKQKKLKEQLRHMHLLLQAVVHPINLGILKLYPVHLSDLVIFCLRYIKSIAFSSLLNSRYVFYKKKRREREREKRRNIYIYTHIYISYFISKKYTELPFLSQRLLSR